MISWEAGLMYMNSWVDASNIFRGIKKNWKKWQMLECLMRKYSIEIPIYVVWSRPKFVINRFGKPSFPDGVLRV
jgi:hypothetical protein